MEYTPTLKEVMTAFPLEGRPDIDPNDDEYKEKIIFYKGDFVRPLWCALHSGSDAKSPHESVASLMEVMKKAKQDGWMSSIENSLKAPRGDLLVLTDEVKWAKLNTDRSGVCVCVQLGLRCPKTSLNYTISIAEEPFRDT